MMIDIETSVLRSMSAAANSALIDLQAAETVLQSITEHHDWGCKERGHINSQIRSCKNEMKRIQNNGAQFHSAITTVAAEFEATEKSIGSMFESLEGILGDILNVSEGLAGRKSDVLSGILKSPKGAFDNISEFKKALRAMSIVDFRSLVKGMEE